MYLQSLCKTVCFGLSLLFYTVSFYSSANTQIQPKAVSALITDIAQAGHKLIAVGERGHIFYLDESWKQVASPTSTNLTNVFFLNSVKGWAVGHDATILQTSDGGKTWSIAFESSEIEKPFLDILFFNEMEGVAVGAYGLFYRTVDGGNTWSEEFHEELLLDDDKAYLEDLKTNDPEGYKIEKASLLPHFNKILKTTDGRTILIGELGLVSISSNKGHFFTKTEFPYEGSMFTGIETQNGFIFSGLRGNVFKTDKILNGWHKLKTPIDSSIFGSVIINNETFLVGNSGAVLRVKNDRSIVIVKQLKGQNILAIAQNENGHVWLGGTQGLQLLDLNKQQ
ncbi:hypothetical protein D5R81_10990 [Parashewanella spongiae]|uniref:Photosynthesis system II assembly factor Ycf48/Hcf136-like domain-containing protein n=1 Tax=Parashewanella spongiae TaxID=342950 RepID=A0A3A6U0X3_9GAMM|nr:YCF48-related protein [Parashewanella spongiae]MCL1078489.1 YCF48-related protein [Parashewanella spongiae]RJY14672.1 hypothetical protein D5R81_10990 [Parashewanella spongiae]